ncbi:30S ribosomal protein S17 [Synechocystis sp. PCC 7509]|uniref:30S ribosomal protein S17 n=1 Tax=Synechocystis sp. PCC 7509 TaxID=927677 RepID=UPI0002ACC344|nr:30S ribosomal protein S17 [Synechocystis sp. PCC 7509]
MAVKERVGLVVSDKMQKTVVVAIENRSPHPKYGKIVVRTQRYKVHDEENKCVVGDRVRIQETRPLSKTKRWVVIDILNRTVATTEATEEAQP